MTKGGSYAIGTSTTLESNRAKEKRNVHYLKNSSFIYVVCREYHMDTQGVSPYFEGSR